MKKDSTTDKKVIFVKKYLKRSISRKIERFCWSLDEHSRDSKLLDTVKACKIPFHSKPFLSKIPSQPIVVRKGEDLVKLEVKEVLKK